MRTSPWKLIALKRLNARWTVPVLFMMLFASNKDIVILYKWKLAYIWVSTMCFTIYNVVDFGGEGTNFWNSKFPSNVPFIYFPAATYQHHPLSKQPHSPEGEYRGRISRSSDKKQNFIMNKSVIFILLVLISAIAASCNKKCPEGYYCGQSFRGEPKCVKSESFSWNMLMEDEIMRRLVMRSSLLDSERRETSSCRWSEPCDLTS